MKRKPGKPREIIDIAGQRFGRLLALEHLPTRYDRSGAAIIWWRCRCDCGETTEVRGACLRKGKTKSCGCLRREVAPQRSKSFRREGTP